MRIDKDVVIQYLLLRWGGLEVVRNKFDKAHHSRRILAKMN